MSHRTELTLALTDLVRMLAVAVKPMYLQWPRFDLVVLDRLLLQHTRPALSTSVLRAVTLASLWICSGISLYVTSATDTVFVPQPAMAKAIITTPSIATTE